jgi:thiaminase/transcriptional activator TenA
MTYISFSHHLRKIADPIWQKEQNHPFIKQIGNGTLKLEKFQYFLKQDYLFLIGFSRLIALIIAKCEKLEDMRFFSNLLDDTLNVEMNLHVSFSEEFNITSSDIIETKASPTTVAYTNHLINIGYSQSALHAAVAILPCSWGYSEIGKKLYKLGVPNNAPLYAKWIEMYNSYEFAQLASSLRDFIDRESEDVSVYQKKSLENIFVQSSHLEYEFWNAAWNI